MRFKFSSIAFIICAFDYICSCHQGKFTPLMGSYIFPECQQIIKIINIQKVTIDIRLILK